MNKSYLVTLMGSFHREKWFITIRVDSSAQFPILVTHVYNKSTGTGSSITYSSMSTGAPTIHDNNCTPPPAESRRGLRRGHWP